MNVRIHTGMPLFQEREDDEMETVVKENRKGQSCILTTTEAAQVALFNIRETINSEVSGIFSVPPQQSQEESLRKIKIKRKRKKRKRKAKEEEQVEVTGRVAGRFPPYVEPPSDRVLGESLGVSGKDGKRASGSNRERSGRDTVVTMKNQFQQQLHCAAIFRHWGSCYSRHLFVVKPG
jgi:hypothetical protein